MPRPVRVDDLLPCPCGRGAPYSGCCGPFLDGSSPATAEELMRSRYTAFAVGDAEYVLTSWHPGTRPDDIELDRGLRWESLEIVATEAGSAGERRGTVEFRAFWRSGDARGVLHERSRFVFQSARWWYLDGLVHSG